MKHKTTLFFLFCLTLSITSFAQTEKMDQDDKREARSTRIRDKTDYNLFHRQMLSLKEYSDERRKIPNLQKANKMTVKVSAVVDTTIDAGDKTLIGYIRQDIGDNSSNVYEVTFDRALKKIVNVKYTGEGDEVEKEEKAPPAKTIHKKNKDDDDDDDPDDAKPSKKDKDDDKD
jgi:hypothetical protein